MKKKHKTSAEVVDVTDKGFVLRVFAEEYCAQHKLPIIPKEYCVSFEEYPHFWGASEDEIRHVTLSYDHLCWEELEVDLFIDNLEHPERYPCVVFTAVQRERLARYKQEQKHSPRK